MGRRRLRTAPPFLVSAWDRVSALPSVACARRGVPPRVATTDACGRARMRSAVIAGAEGARRQGRARRGPVVRPHPARSRPGADGRRAERAAVGRRRLPKARTRRPANGGGRPGRGTHMAHGGPRRDRPGAAPGADALTARRSPGWRARGCGCPRWAAYSWHGSPAVPLTRQR